MCILGNTVAQILLRNYNTPQVMSQFAFTVQMKKILKTSTTMTMFFMFKCQRKNLQAKVMTELFLICCELLFLVFVRHVNCFFVSNFKFSNE